MEFLQLNGTVLEDQVNNVSVVIKNPNIEERDENTMVADSTKIGATVIDANLNEKVFTVESALKQLGGFGRF